MRVGPVDSMGFARVLGKNNTQNLLVLSPSPQALLDQRGVQAPDIRQQPESAAAFSLPQSTVDLHAILRPLPADGWSQAATEALSMAVDEGSDMRLNDIATRMVQLHDTCSTLQGAAVLQAVRGLRQARVSGRASQAFQTFQVAFLQMLQVLRAESEVVAVTQRKRQPHSLAGLPPRQQPPPSAVRFTEPVVFSSPQLLEAPQVSPPPSLAASSRRSRCSMQCGAGRQRTRQELRRCCRRTCSRSCRP